MICLSSVVVVIATADLAREPGTVITNTTPYQNQCQWMVIFLHDIRLAGSTAASQSEAMLLNPVSQKQFPQRIISLMPILRYILWVFWGKLTTLIRIAPHSDSTNCHPSILLSYILVHTYIHISTTTEFLLILPRGALIGWYERHSSLAEGPTWL